jgi:hypothetical protein
VRSFWQKLRRRARALRTEALALGLHAGLLGVLADCRARAEAVMKR